MSDAAQRGFERDAGGLVGDESVVLSQRLAFLDLSAADAERLHQLRAQFRHSMDEFVELFYDHLFRFEPTARFLESPALVERLKEAQKHHLMSLVEAEWDDRYVERRQQVGRAHAEAGLEPQYFLGAYQLWARFCLRVFQQAAGRDPDQLLWVESLLKAIFLDIGLTLDAYFSRSTQNLRQALDMLWKANVDLRRFAQLTSHDLKTPLATVANYCEEVLDAYGDQMPAEASELIAAARAGTFRMSKLIDELLASSVTTTPGELDALAASGEAMHEALDRLRPALRQKQIEVLLPDAWPMVCADRVRLREAFYNVLSNAVKFIDRQPGRIVVEVRSTDIEHVFSITDNGPGIPPEERERVFIPFGRLAMHHDRPGTGLGLYFTKSLIEEQGGRVWVESEVGRGSSFHMALPLEPHGSQTHDVRSQARSGAAHAPSPPERAETDAATRDAPDDARSGGGESTSSPSTSNAPTRGNSDAGAPKGNSSDRSKSKSGKSDGGQSAGNVDSPPAVSTTRKRGRKKPPAG